MTRVLELREHIIENSQSILGFETTGGSNWPVWDRFLTVHGKKTYHIGNICGTCRFFFEELGGISRAKTDNVTITTLVQAMTQGLLSIEPSFLEGISPIIPNGEYVVSLIQTKPRLVTPGYDEDYFAHENVWQWGLETWDLPHYPKIKYYRGIDQQLSEKAEFFEFIVPLYPHRWLNKERIAEFQTMISGGTVPTAICLSVLDVKQAWNRDVGHSCLTHYLVDGHHKVMAANLERKPITLLAFIAVKEGISTRADIDRVLSVI